MLYNKRPGTDLTCDPALMWQITQPFMRRNRTGHLLGHLFLLRFGFKMQYPGCCALNAHRADKR